MLQAINNLNIYVKLGICLIWFYDMKKFLLPAALALPLIGFTNTVSGENLLEIYQQALQNDPEWAAIESNYEADKQKVLQAKAGLKPSLSINYSKSRTSSTAPNIDVALSDGLNQGISNCSDGMGGITASCPGELLSILQVPDQGLFQLIEGESEKQSTTVDNFSLKFSQPLFNLERLYAYRSAKAGLSKTESDFDKARQDFFMRLASAYFETLKAQEELAFALAENQAISDQLQLTKTRYELGLIRITDVNEAQSAVDLSQTGVILADSIYQNSLEKLSATTNTSISQLVPLAKDFPISMPKPEGFQAWIDLALKHNKPLSSAQASVTAAEYDVIKKHSGHAPTVDLFASIDNIKTDAGDGNRFESSSNLTSDSESETIGLRVTIPLYSGGLTSSQARESRHRLDASTSHLEQTTRNVTASIKNGYRNVVNDIKRIEVINLTLDSTKRALKSTEEGYADGNRNIFDVLQAQRSLFSARRDLSNARYDYIINSLKLKQIAGILDAEDLIIVNDWLAR